MTPKFVVSSFITLALLLWQPAVLGLTLTTPIPTFKEIHPLSAEQALLNAEKFTQQAYSESQGFSAQTYWHKLTFAESALEQENNFHLKLNYYVIEHLDFYLFHGDQLINHWKRGALDDWHTDTEYYDGIWIPLQLSSHQNTTLLIRKQGNSPLLTPFELLNAKDTLEKKQYQPIFWSVIISSLLILLTHNVFVFALLRQPGFLYYLALNIVILIALSAITGFNRWIFPESVSQWVIRQLFLVFGIGAWILFRFSVHFLKEIHIPAPQSIIRRYGDWIFVIFLISTQLLSVKTSALGFALIEVFMFIICTYWGVKAYAKGFLAVRFYLFSWFFLIVGSILNTLIFWKVLPINPITESIFPVACLLQLLSFSFAFADKAKQIETNRQQQALIDQPTGLPNRTYYFDQLPIHLANLNHSYNQPHNDPELALIIIDITNHRALSQAFGPAKADTAMVEIIEHIHQKTAEMNGLLSFPLPNKTLKKIIRISTQNILLISTTPALIKTQIQFIQHTLDYSTLVNNIHFRHQYKIGSALYPSQGANLDKLYQNALIAKNSVTYSSGNWLPFTDNLKNNHAHQLHLITQLTNDIQQEALYFDIQPQVDLLTRQIIGGEVLVRWNNDKLGQVSPAEFIPLAEQTGLIYKLTDLLLEKVFQWAHQHPHALLNKRLSINISALDLLQEDFAHRVSLLIQRHRLSPQTFTIEITETSVFQNNAIVHDNVKQLHQAGFKLAIDDFGVGYSSMQNLVALQTDELKIDQFFIMSLLEDAQSQILCRNMIDLSKALNIISVAEGIESEGILQLLQDWHCQVGQGYHLYRPMSPADYLALLNKKVPPLSTPTNRA
ncbi:EAL domain-containing protein [Marinomonas sp. M1K-6]|uniref:EAL domain-containing protein n=1 Tax=Marinomonas profundi TaxID=2726122 RepID=A0A847QZB3_9GAMM|nr:EAL domain-containing protein [Marinomonas profundi]NLQ16311.1 EAL domain-containing protein [Marinomonas profundi]UDV03113.1 EAL domain-containing protein [Marinomonas profundi]